MKKIATSTTIVMALVLAACGGGKDQATAAASSTPVSGAASGTGTGTGTTTIATTGPGPKGGAVLYSDFRASKKLVLHQRDGLAITPTKLRDRLATMEVALDAFDGAFLSLPTATAGVMKATPMSAATIASELEPIYAIAPTKFKYNFAVVTASHDLDPYDDWSVVYANMGNLAKAAKDAGLVGIVIDDESLGGLRVNYPYDLKNAATKSIDQYRAQMQLVGKNLMQAIVTSFPDAVVVVLRGPAGSEPKSPGTLVNRESDTAQLLGPFFAGFVEGNGARTLVVDGGTDYGLRTTEQFSGSYAWRKTSLPSPDVGAAFMSAGVRSAWPDAVRVSFGVNEIDGAHANLLPNVPMLYANTLAGALRSSDLFVWASFTLTDLTKAVAKDDFPTAARNARALVASATAHLASQSFGTGTGLMAEYFSNIDETELAQTVVDAVIDNSWTGTGPVQSILSGQNDNFSVVWTGYLEAPLTGTYGIFGTTDDGMQILIDGKLVVDAFYYQGATEHAGSIDLVAGKRYAVKIRYFQGGGGTEAHFAWQPPNNDKGVVPQAWLYPTN